MKHIETHSSNQRFGKVREELSNLLSIIMGTIAEEAQDGQNFEYFEQNATSQEDLALIQELARSSQEIDQQAQKYQDSIGIASSTKTQSKTPKKSSTKTTISNPITTKIQPIAPTREENNISKMQSGFDIEH